ncbi:YVTN repeat-like/Quino protein amine dehydrogenase [Tothia fuscella]|uniref:YVTN repeat-like/Quino protein amine dehydrogenase n=1 Tax=Tothia fuscella TaxID=1048955 RepID=A0A9P4U041_9PEZI|nr:YVTN repeat-like/Quino protein amine dehydrogenase [Tothia fuscella]
MNVRHPFDQSPEPIVLGVEYNEDSTVFTAATSEGYRIYDSTTGKLISEREFEGSIGFASILSRSRFVALIGGGSSPHYPPNKFILWDGKSKQEVFKIEYSYRPLRASLTSTHYVVIFERGLMLYKLEPKSKDNSTSSRIAIYETASNLHGLCCLGSRKLAFPGRKAGQVQIVDLATRKVSILPAHSSPLRALAFSKNENIVATASDTGTLIRLWSTAQEARLNEVRRGLDRATIFSISFSANGQYLAVTSDKSTLHIFDLVAHDTPMPSQYGPSGHSRSKSSSSSRPVTVPPSRHRTTSTTTTGSGNSPGSRNYGLTPPKDRYRLSSSPTDRTSVALSDFSSQKGTHAPPAWNDMLRQQQQQQPSSRYSSSHASTAMRKAPDSTKTERDISSPHKPAQKWGNLANLPFAPKILSDTYSIMSCPFDMGDERPITSSSSSKSKAEYQEFEEALGGPPSSSNGKEGGETKDTVWWPGGRPPKGKIAWVDDDRLVIVGAGRDARWELFGIAQYDSGQKAVVKVGWKRFLEDEGLE